MGAPLSLKPTKVGRKILDLVVDKYGSIQAAARAAGVSEPTLRRRIYQEPGARIELDTALKLEAIGVRREWLVAV
jgi:hypothetical protein